MGKRAQEWSREESKANAGGPAERGEHWRKKERKERSRNQRRTRGTTPRFAMLPRPPRKKTVCNQGGATESQYFVVWSQKTTPRPATRRSEWVEETRTRKKKRARVWTSTEEKAGKQSKRRLAEKNVKKNGLRGEKGIRGEEGTSRCRRSGNTPKLTYPKGSSRRGCSER